MDSQSFDSDIGSISAPNTLLLEEDQILFSQPCLILQDMMGSEAEENYVSVFIDEENRSKVTPPYSCLVRLRCTPLFGQSKSVL
jgi:hypothetical protein